MSKLGDKLCAFRKILSALGQADSAFLTALKEAESAIDLEKLPLSLILQLGSHSNGVGTAPASAQTASSAPGQSVQGPPLAVRNPTILSQPSPGGPISQNRIASLATAPSATGASKSSSKYHFIYAKLAIDEAGLHPDLLA